MLSIKLVIMSQDTIIKNISENFFLKNIFTLLDIILAIKLKKNNERIIPIINLNKYKKIGKVNWKFSNLSLKFVPLNSKSG